MTLHEAICTIDTFLEENSYSGHGMPYSEWKEEIAALKEAEDLLNDVLQLKVGTNIHRMYLSRCKEVANKIKVLIGK